MPKLRASRGTRNRFVPYPNSRPCRGSGISLEARLASLYPRSSNSSSKPLRSVVVRHLIGSNDTKKRTFRTWTRLRDIGLVLELMLEECSTTIQDAIKLFKDFLRRLNGKLKHQNCCIHLPSIRGLSILRDVLVRYHNARLTMPNHERIPEMYEEYIQETVKRMVSLNNFNKLA
ncbi:hypothetical protein EV182_005412 [Spiromyces aspiralis]|uniref:Uncharacterized protein n=1 Tax=Spiromyces aspiralis TaxID=68401 RepID=A0ACC1HA06_9FUNG|nr:hypothetical protein EV182_005412 [Spiromyces aspiralis]